MIGLLLFLSCNTEPVIHQAIVVEKEILQINEHEPYKAGILRRGPLKQGYWDRPPDVRVCATAPISQRRVEKGLDFWRKLGYSFGTVTYNDTTRHCVEDIFSYGTIIIDLIDGTHREPAVATTTTWIDSDTREILKAKIVMKSRWANVERVLEHEFGHAFGFKDYNREGHIMHHNWGLAGRNTRGLVKPE
tara:strand:+ start:1007 stop:1576 length:570 start_codon:yes stop_codon:yes gene_type:complete